METGSLTEKYEEYQLYLNNHQEWIEEGKKRVADIIRRKQLVSIMNDTKWLKLQVLVNERLPFPPAYLCKYVTDKEEPNLKQFSRNVPSYFGNWTNYYEEGFLRCSILNG